MYIGSKSWQSQDDSFIETCKENILAGELYTKYAGKLEHIRTLGYQIDIECREDPETLSLMQKGILPKWYASPILPDKVWYFKAYFRADQKLEIELLIGQYIAWPKLEVLGMRNGEEWVYEPVLN